MSERVTTLHGYNGYMGAMPSCNDVTDVTHLTEATVAVCGESRAVPPLISTKRSAAPWLLLPLAAIACALALLFAFNPAESAFYPTCTFYWTTGLLCPGCGSLRAMHQLLHGHIAPAFRCNALLISGLPVAGWFAVRFAVRRLRGDNPRFTLPAHWMWMGLVILVAFAILRNLSGFRWLTP